MVGSTWRQAEAEAAATPQSDFKAIVVLVTTALCLTFQYPARSGDIYGWLFPGREFTNFEARSLWAVWVIGTFTILPVAVIWGIFRERVRDYGTKLQGAAAGLPLYLGMVAVMAAVLLVISHNKEFQGTYPFYAPGPSEPWWPRFYAWELLYALQFVALEFFFRGFLLHGLRPRLGGQAIFAMMVPYCMIHFGKPMPETLASIIAGIVLGFMSLRTRSIWLGAALHISVAWSMDLLSLWHRGVIRF